MAPHTRSAAVTQHASDSELDSDAPEAVSLSQSKKQVKQLETKHKNAELAERQSKRAVNREKDRQLKERAQRNKKVANLAAQANESGRDDEVGDLEARMERAMAEANEESGEDESNAEQEFEAFTGITADSDDIGQGSEGDHNEDDSEHDDNDSEEDSGSENAEEDEDEDESEGDDEDASEGDEDEDEQTPHSIPTKRKFNPDHLPDELFTAAFTSKQKRKPEEVPASEEAENPPTKKRKASKRKDIIIGSRTIRTLPSSNQPSIPATLPSKKIEKFLDRTLALKGGRQLGKGWERRPANIGVLKRNGPALNFVRTS